MQVGDVLIRREDSGEWSVVKVLAVDSWPDGAPLLHCLMYRATAEPPTPATVPSLEVLAYHAPLRPTAFRGDWSVLGSSPVIQGDLIGFHEYLKRVDFQRYLEATGQDLETVLTRANSHYAAGGELTLLRRYREAIDEYTRATDLFPLFHEAIDRRGFNYMHLGDYRRALDDFDHSLHLNPDGEAAWFASGECLLRLGDLAEAEEVFATGALDSTQYRDRHEQYLARVRELRAEQSPPTAPCA
ncbi:tetratricopeptide repeat protein [Nocardia panacis]|uniref:tetratricopeptide repeat protein n=1 Tax=Nocardia panacis TaxID=2340916 RepID=UPI0011C36998|nr:tetratricopeptide repeat protein [Nocardia panacis]